jgi:hypothetical protein
MHITCRFVKGGRGGGYLKTLDPDHAYLWAICINALDSTNSLAQQACFLPAYLPVTLLMFTHTPCQPILFPLTHGSPKYFWGNSKLASWTLASLTMWQTQWNSVPDPFSCIVSLFFQIQFKPFVSHHSQGSKGHCHVAIRYKYKCSFGLLHGKEKISLFLIFSAFRVRVTLFDFFKETWAGSPRTIYLM